MKSNGSVVSLLVALVAASSLQAQFLADLKGRGGEGEGGRVRAFGDSVEVKGDYLSASRKTGEVVATGNVVAVSGPTKFMTDRFTRSAQGRMSFGEDALLTTCSNSLGHLHWRLSTVPPTDSLPKGEIQFQDVARTNAQGEVEHRALYVNNAWLYLNEFPVVWVPFWYYPLDTNYGWRFLPGYTSRWGGYFLSGYVYDIVNEGKPDACSLGGSSYVDYRTRNGFAVGQTVRWNLKDWGHGKVRGWYGWDENYDRYEDHWTDHRRHWSHWGSDVDRERYRVLLQHDADVTERDAFRLRAEFLSDSHVLNDFFNRGPWQREGRLSPVNEAWYEHRENDYAGGVSVSGMANDFYGGTSRLPEGWFAVSPQPIWDLPLNYESQTRFGYLNRTPGEAATDDLPYRYHPYIGLNGNGADYQAFRVDSNHRVSLPFKFADVLSFVPRAGYRCTWWSDSGSAESNYLKASGDGLARQIAEVGFTASTRASAWLNDDWRHTFEPYLDYSFQRANLNEGDSRRHYVFDAYDDSVDWLEQFGFEGRGLPFSWHGVRPGVRNLFQRRDERGVLRTVFDTDFYAAVPFDDESRYENGVLAGRTRDPEYGNYARSECVVPGVRLRASPWRDFTFGTRAEYDCEEETVAYADVSMRHRLSRAFSWHVAYIGRDHRIFDYLPSEPVPLENGNAGRWNEELSNMLSLGFEHELFYWLRWSPYIRHDCRRDEVRDVGVWFDFLTDCLGYRVEFSHEDGYRRIDGSRERSDDRVAFFIYLRALGPSSMLDITRF